MAAAGDQNPIWGEEEQQQQEQQAQAPESGAAPQRIPCIAVIQCIQSIPWIYFQQLQEQQLQVKRWRWWSCGRASWLSHSRASWALLWSCGWAWYSAHVPRTELDRVGTWWTDDEHMMNAHNARWTCVEFTTPLYPKMLACTGGAEVLWHKWVGVVENPTWYKNISRTGDARVFLVNLFLNVFNSFDMSILESSKATTPIVNGLGTSFQASKNDIWRSSGTNHRSIAILNAENPLTSMKSCILSWNTKIYKVYF